MAADPPSPLDTEMPLGADLPSGTRFIGTGAGTPGWGGTDHPALADLNSCVACGLCLPTARRTA